MFNVILQVMSYQLFWWISSCLIRFVFFFCLQCLHEKTEVDKKLSSFISQAASPSDNSVLVKNLQEELKHYVSMTSA